MLKSQIYTSFIRLKQFFFSPPANLVFPFGASRRAGPARGLVNGHSSQAGQGSGIGVPVVSKNA
jgi:hypothetical protein